MLLKWNKGGWCYGGPGQNIQPWMQLERRYLHEVSEMEWESLSHQIQLRILSPTYVFRYENLLDQHLTYHGIRLLPCMVLTKRQRHLMNTIQKVTSSCFVLSKDSYHLMLQVEL